MPYQVGTPPPKRRMIATRWKHLDTFTQAWCSLGLEVDVVFVPLSMMPLDDDSPSVRSNADLDSFRSACSDGSVCWVHGSSSPCTKSALRGRELSACFVSDIVRSDTGICAGPTLALNAPLGSLNSDLSTRSVRSLSVLERAGGWQDDKQTSESTYLYVFNCQAPEARTTHRYNVKFMQVDIPPFEQIVVTPPPNSIRAFGVIAESRKDLACMAQRTKERVIRIHRVQKSADRCRWTFSADAEAKDMVLGSLRAKRVATYETDAKGDSIAILFLQSNIFVDIVSAVNALGGIRVGLVREAPRWMVIRGSHSDVESAVGCCKNVLRDLHSTSVITGRFVDIISFDNDQCVLECSLSLKYRLYVCMRISLT